MENTAARTSRMSSAPRERPSSTPHSSPRFRGLAPSTGRRPTASSSPWTASQTTPRCPTGPSGSRFTGPGTRNPHGLTGQTPRTRRCAFICAAPRALGFPTRPPTRRRRPRATRRPPAAPPQAAPRRNPRPFAPSLLGRRGGWARRGGGSGNSSGFFWACAAVETCAAADGERPHHAGIHRGSQGRKEAQGDSRRFMMRWTTA